MRFVHLKACCLALVLTPKLSFAQVSSTNTTVTSGNNTNMIITANMNGYITNSTGTADSTLTINSGVTITRTTTINQTWSGVVMNVDTAKTLTINVEENATIRGGNAHAWAILNGSLVNGAIANHTKTHIINKGTIDSNHAQRAISAVNGQMSIVNEATGNINKMIWFNTGANFTVESQVNNGILLDNKGNINATTNVLYIKGKSIINSGNMAAISMTAATISDKLENSGKITGTITLGSVATRRTEIGTLDNQNTGVIDNFVSAAQITTFNNAGEITQNFQNTVGGGQGGVITTLNNHGTIKGSFSNVAQGTITTINNTGSIGDRATNANATFNNTGTITTINNNANGSIVPITNTGTINALNNNAGATITSITNNRTITTLTNAGTITNGVTNTGTNAVITTLENSGTLSITNAKTITTLNNTSTITSLQNNASGNINTLTNNSGATIDSITNATNASKIGRAHV